MKTAHSPTTHERLEAQLALRLPAPPPRGAPPSLAEIDAWRQGRLTAARAAEVMAYVARDPAYYQQWFELRRAAAEAVAPVARPTRGPGVVTWVGPLRDLARWLGARWPSAALVGGGLATALLVGLAVTTLRPPGQTPEWTRLLDEDQARWGPLAGGPATDWPWRGGVTRDTRGPTAAALTPEQQSFQVGVRTVLAPAFAATPAGPAILQGLASQPGLCAVGDPACRDRQAAAQALGRWAALAHLACAQGRADPAQLGRRLTQWGGLVAAQSLEPWRTVLGDGGAAADDAGPPCERVRGLIAAGLLAR